MLAVQGIVSLDLYHINYMSIAAIICVCVQPRSQGLSSLPPLLVGRKTLVAAGHVPSCDTNFSNGVGSTNNFCRSQLKRKKGPSKFSSPVVSFTQVRSNIFVYI